MRPQLPASPAPGYDPKFTFWLPTHVGKVLEAHGYPPVSGREHVELSVLLLTFIYGSD